MRWPASSRENGRHHDRRTDPARRDDRRYRRRVREWEQAWWSNRHHLADHRPGGRRAFPADMLPEIYNALEVTRTTAASSPWRRSRTLGNDAVRAIAMSTYRSLRRGATVQDMGGPITVPVGLRRSAASSMWSASRSTRPGRSTRQHDIRSTGRRRASRTRRPRSRSSRPASRSSTSSPLYPGRQDRRLRRRRCRQDGHHHRADPQHRGRARRILRLRRRVSAPAKEPSSGARCRSRASPTRRCSSSVR